MDKSSYKGIEYNKIRVCEPYHLLTTRIWISEVEELEDENR
jgi:hypothetical protein